MLGGLIESIHDDLQAHLINRTYSMVSSIASPPTLKLLADNLRRFPDTKTSVLRSYKPAYYEDLNKATYFNPKVRPLISNLMVDSGTFEKYVSEKEEGRYMDLNSDNLDNKRIWFDGYEGFLLFLRRNNKLPEHYFSFDPRYDTTVEAFRENHHYLRELEKSDLNPIPVIHWGGEEEVEKYLHDDRYEFIAISSAIRLPAANSMINAIYQAGKKVHYFGKSTFELAKYPIHSADSSSWTKIMSNKGGRHIKFWDNQKGPPEKWDGKSSFDQSQTIPMTRRGQKGLDAIVRQRIDAYLNTTFGYTYEDLFDDTNNALIVNLHFFASVLPAKISKAHQEQGFNTDW